MQQNVVKLEGTPIQIALKKCSCISVNLVTLKQSFYCTANWSVFMQNITYIWNKLTGVLLWHSVCTLVILSICIPVCLAYVCVWFKGNQSYVHLVHMVTLRTWTREPASFMSCCRGDRSFQQAFVFLWATVRANNCSHEVEGNRTWQSLSHHTHWSWQSRWVEREG